MPMPRSSNPSQSVQHFICLRRSDVGTRGRRWPLGSDNGSCVAPGTGRFKRRPRVRWWDGRAYITRPATTGPGSRSAGHCIPTTGVAGTREAGRRAIDYAFGDLDLDQVCSVILPENARSIAVAKRLGFRLGEERVISHFPSMPHGIWWLNRDNWLAAEP